MGPETSAYTHYTLYSWELRVHTVTGFITHKLVQCVLEPHNI